MATLYITEYAGAGLAVSGPVQAAITPAIANQTVAIGGVASSSAFNTATRLVRLHADAICSFAIALNPTATTAMARMAAGQTEYFTVTPGHKVSVITNV